MVVQLAKQLPAVTFTLEIYHYIQKYFHKRTLFMSQLNPFYSISYISEVLLFKIIPSKATSSLQVFNQNLLCILLPISSSLI